ncbi:PH domain-containing protein [Streptomyces sp. NPDC020379]|uniref:PH domain-containing protein n=1 Tax=Streptomyces sp. NPDC020379 TaxID=3365071 RepID=UPI0037A51025
MDVHEYRIAVSKGQWTGCALMTLCGLLCLLRVTFGPGWAHYVRHFDGSLRETSVANYPSPDLMLGLGMMLLTLAPLYSLAVIWRTWTTPEGIRTRGILRRRSIPWLSIAGIHIRKHGGGTQRAYYHLEVRLHSGKRLCLPGLQEYLESELVGPRTEIVTRWKAAHVTPGPDGSWPRDGRGAVPQP